MPLFFLGVRAESQPVKLQLGKEINRIIKNEEDVFVQTHSGFVLSVIINDSTYRYFFGNSSFENGLPMTDTSYFPLGGLTHALIALTANTLEEERPGVLNTPIGSLITDTTFDAFKNLSLSNLLSHSSGFPKILPGISHLRSDLDQPYSLMHKDSLLLHLARWYKRNPTKEINYQHSQYNYFLAYQILYTIAPDLTDSIYRLQLMQQYPANGQDQQLVHLYTDNKIQKPWQIYNGLAPILGGTGNIIIVENLVHELLKSYQSSRQWLFKFRIDKKNSEKYISNAGFRIQNCGKSGYVYMLTGNSDRSSAIILLCPGTNTAVIALGNSGYSLHILAMDILRMINYNWKLKKFQ